MDKPSEQKLDAKKWGDTDIGVHDYGAGGKREQLNGLWSFTTITGGSRDQRLRGNNYCKTHHEAYEKNKNNPKYLLGEALNSIGTRGPPLENISEPRIVSTYGGVKTTRI
jgi:hypothetical protein